MLNDCCGSLQYMAPEIIENRPYSQQCDVWSIGVLDYLLLCGLWPFYSENQCEQELCTLILTENPDFTGYFMCLIMCCVLTELVLLIIVMDKTHTGNTIETLIT